MVVVVLVATITEIKLRGVMMRTVIKNQGSNEEQEEEKESGDDGVILIRD